MKTAFPAALLALTLSGPAVGQLPQMRPELCGSPTGIVSLPPRLTAISDPQRLQVRVLPNGGAAVTIQGPYEVAEACPIPDGRLVIFGNLTNGMTFSIVDPKTPSVLDTVLAYDPVLSPDGRWVVFRKFYPRHTELPSSDEYLLYNLSVSPIENRAPGRDRNEDTDVGIPIYPAGWKNESGDNIGAPEAQQHWHQSAFYWSPDSRSILFADQNQGKRMLVLISIDQKGTAAASVSAFPDSLDCDDPRESAKGRTAKPTGLRQVVFGAETGSDRMLFIDFDGGVCVPKKMQLHSDTFQPAQLEIRAPAALGRKSVKRD